MNLLVLALWSAGLVQLVIAAANAIVARRLDYRNSLSASTRIVRQIFGVHAGYIAAVILWFGLLCLLFAPRLASGEPMMRFLTAGFATFWGIRAVLQVTLYDKEVRRRYRGEDVAFLLACAMLATVFLVCAIQ